MRVKGCHEMQEVTLDVETNRWGNNNPRWSAFRSAVICGKAETRYRRVGEDVVIQDLF